MLDLICMHRDNICDVKTMLYENCRSIYIVNIMQVHFIQQLNLITRHHLFSLHESLDYTAESSLVHVKLL